MGRSAGVCVEGSGFYEADTTRLNRRIGRNGPFDDAFVSFNKLTWRTVPFLPNSWFINAQTSDFARFSEIWFENFMSGSGNPPSNHPHNFFHVIGSSFFHDQNGITFGISQVDYDFLYLMEGELEAYAPCTGVVGACNREVTAHELGHLFRVNVCAQNDNCPNEASGGHDYRGWWQFGGQGCPAPHPWIMRASEIFAIERDHFC